MDDYPCKCWNLEERFQPCFNCRWNARGETTECVECGQELFYDFGAWRNHRGDQTCTIKAAHTTRLGGRAS